MFACTKTRSSRSKSPLLQPHYGFVLNSVLSSVVSLHNQIKEVRSSSLDLFPSHHPPLCHHRPSQLFFLSLKVQFAMKRCSDLPRCVQSDL
ncbi:hypothetical protein L596_009471 [Steinernema carpocapsae]|uniref:Uncharacterized protein n=1 Tax=Steinernema carpocapsae TaxID=34508 RepID=A0A4U5PFG3_STECR|nr:hypothetical protein L596_009471 [Steinernema carpocapsae]